MNMDFYGIPVVESRTTELLFGKLKPEGFYQVKRASSCGTKAGDISGVGWNGGFYENQVEGGGGPSELQINPLSLRVAHLSVFLHRSN
jgi:hypothetical protein